MGENDHGGAVSEPQPEAPRGAEPDALTPQAIEPDEPEAQPYQFEDYGDVPVEAEEPTVAVPHVPAAGGPDGTSQTAVLWGAPGGAPAGGSEDPGASGAAEGAAPSAPVVPAMAGAAADPQPGIYPGGYPMQPGAYPGVYPGYQGTYPYGHVPGQPGGPVYGPPGPGAPFGQPVSDPAGGRRRVVPATVAVVAVVIAAAIGAGVGHLAWKTPSSSTNTAGGSPTDPYGGASGNPFGGYPGQGGGGSSPSAQPTGTANASAVSGQVDPGLVDVNSTFSYQSTGGSGTGMVLTSTGEVLTNNHVIDEATSISVTDIGNGKTYTATVVGYDSTQDIAVLQLQNASGLKTINVGDSDQAAVGQSVVAIGNAGGVGGTPSPAAGEITGLNQSITAADDLTGNNEQLTGMIETDAQIESGDSGGPLATTSGDVIGMDTAASESQGAGGQGSGGSNVTTGNGYAIPINEAISVAKQIESGKSSSTVHSGATAFLGVDVSGTSGTAQITSVIQGTAAATLGLTTGDVITSLDNQTISSASDLTNVVLSLKPGQSVPIAWTDTQGQQHTGTVTMGSGPAQ